MRCNDQGNVTPFGLSRLAPMVSVLALAFGAACSQSSGDDGPPNPAPRVDAKSSTNMNGTWQCTSSKLIETTNPQASPYRVGQRLMLSGNRLFADDDGFLARDNIEAALGFELDYYLNQADGRLLRFLGGWSSAPRPEVIDLMHYGLVLAVQDDNTLIGYEAAVSRDDSSSPQLKWVAQLTFRRVMAATGNGGPDNGPDAARSAASSKIVRLKPDDTPR